MGLELNKQKNGSFPGVKQSDKGKAAASETNSVPREPSDIRWIRTCLNLWPFKRGKGILLRLFGPRLRRRDFLIEIEPGVLIPGELDDWMVLSFFADARHNMPLQLSRSLIRRGDTLMDVGANTGLWALGAALRVGPEGAVHAFEPVPDNFARLTRNLKLNGFTNVTCQKLALSDKCGRTVFYAASDSNSGVGSLTQRGNTDRPIEIEITTVDDYCASHAIARLDLMKVDVEGAELLVFRGAEHLLAAKEAPIIMFETDEVLTAHFGSSSTMIKTLLHQYGYDFFRYTGKRLEAVAVKELHHKQEDLFALKPSHIERHQLLRQLCLSGDDNRVV
jgi:FkbM family methyltransferase